MRLLSLAARPGRTILIEDRDALLGSTGDDCRCISDRRPWPSPSRREGVSPLSNPTSAGSKRASRNTIRRWASSANSLARSGPTPTVRAFAISRAAPNRFPGAARRSSDALCIARSIRRSAGATERPGTQRCGSAATEIDSGCSHRSKPLVRNPHQDWLGRVDSWDRRCRARPSDFGVTMAGKFATPALRGWAMTRPLFGPVTASGASRGPSRTARVICLN